MATHATFDRVRASRTHPNTHTASRRYGSPGAIYTIAVEYDDNGIVREVYSSDGKPHVTDVRDLMARNNLRWPLNHPLSSFSVYQKSE